MGHLIMILIGQCMRLDIDNDSDEPLIRILIGQCMVLARH